MESHDLTPAQCQALREKLGPMLVYLNKLLHRMQNKGFPLDKPLWTLVSRTQKSMQDLVTELRCGAAESTRR
jgi:hypothetical protein